jgi:hypothetical protein
MNSKIVMLINEAIKNRDKRICNLFENDPLFKRTYHLLHELDEDKPELILDIIITACEQKKEAMDKLIEKIRETRKIEELA